MPEGDKKMTFRTPLKQVRGLGAAKDGVDHWWHQRLSAVALIVLVLLAAARVVSLAGEDYATVKAALGQPFWAGVLILFLATAYYHFRLGLQVVIEDYVHGRAARVTMIILNIFVTAALAVASILAVLKLAFGG